MFSEIWIFQKCIFYLFLNVPPMKNNVLTNKSVTEGECESHHLTILIISEGIKRFELY